MNEPALTETSAPAKKKVVLVEDHILFREMLGQLINKNEGMIVCGQTDNIQDAVTIIQECDPDIAIVDITLRGSSGLELIKNLKAQKMRVPVLVLSMHEESVYAERALRAGAKGYITKDEAAAEVVHAIEKVLAGRIYASEAATANILDRIIHVDKAQEPTGVDLLTDRELEVFQLIGRGLNAREIAPRLNLGVSTVDSYRARIKEKLGIRNAAELYQRATQWVTEQGV